LTLDVYNTLSDIRPHTGRQTHCCEVNQFKSSKTTHVTTPHYLLWYSITGNWLSYRCDSWSEIMPSNSPDGGTM